MRSKYYTLFTGTYHDKIHDCLNKGKDLLFPPTNRIWMFDPYYLSKPEV